MLHLGRFEQRLAPLSPPRGGPATTAQRFIRRIAAGCATLLLALPSSRATDVFPAALPDPLIPGFTFPESEATLTRWITEMSRSSSPTIAAEAFERVHRHGWGLWTALTSETGQIHEGHK